MSVQSEIDRIEAAKAAIGTAIAGKGVAVPSGTKLDGMAALIDGIEQSGGDMRIATGNFVPSSVYFTSTYEPITIMGLAFAPKHVIVRLAPIAAASQSMSSSVSRQLLSISKGIFDDNEIYGVYGSRAAGSKQTGTYYTLTLTDDGFVLQGSSGCGLFTLQYDYIAMG